MAEKRPTIQANRQSQKFIETARELGWNESEDALDRVIRKIIPEKRLKPKQDNQSDSK